jgi:hypothetical protein
MPGNAIHAGPESDAHLCRTIFFFAASPPCAPQYDPTTQWNQVTLTAAILEAIWDEIIPLERGYILDYICRIQSNSKIAPSDTSLFIGNYTLHLFVRVVLFVKQISNARAIQIGKQNILNFYRKLHPLTIFNSESN